MKNRYKNILCIGSALLLMIGCNSKPESTIDINFSDKDKYEGKSIEIVNFADSAILASGVITEGKTTLVVSESDSLRFPLFTQIMIDGRNRAYYIIEKGRVEIGDSLTPSKLTPLNEKFSNMMLELDSIENLDDMQMYLDYSEKAYNENKDTPIGTYFGVEWIKYADPQKVDSFLNVAPAEFKSIKKVKQYEEFAKHRALTAPGAKYADFEGESANGRKLKLSTLVKPGKYNIIDFWASWCPYCIKELPELKQLYSDYSDKLEIIGVAVRDKSEDTTNSVNKYEIPWPVLYNTQRIPYDIYGFSGIPHHILIDPEGVIVSRGESVSQLRERIENL